MKGLSYRILAIVVLALLTGLFGYLTSAPLKQGPHRIVALELACNVDQANAFLHDWSTARPRKWQPLLHKSLKWDTWFILSYAPLNALLCWLAAARLKPRRPLLGAFAQALAWAQLLAGVLDFVENYAMTQMIDAATAHNPYPQISFLSASTKFLLIAAFFAIGITAIIDRVRHGPTDVS